MARAPLNSPNLDKADIAVVAPPDAADIELVSEGDLSRLAQDEAFMNEIVKIRISTSTNPNDSPMVNLTVNSHADSIWVRRGVVTPVRRKHVEVLARMRQINYSQKPAQGSDLETGNALYWSAVQVNPFEVIEDKNPAGRAWLDNILAEPY